MRTRYAHLFFVLAALLGGVSAHADTASFTLQLSAPLNTVTLGDKILVDIVLTNTSQNPIEVKEPPDTIVYVENVNGNPVRKTAMEQDFEAPGLKGSSFTFIKRVNPGKTQVSSETITDRYVIDAPGSYLIRVSRSPLEAGTPQILSNLIRVTVTN
jgi:hypothetical protein